MTKRDSVHVPQQRGKEQHTGKDLLGIALQDDVN